MPAPPYRVPRLPPDLREIARTAVEAALAAGAILRRRFRTEVAVMQKGPADVVTAADLEAQRAVLRRIRARFPHHGILAEEGLDLSPAAEWRWILDPLDGTKNFAYGHPTFCVSLAAERGERVAVGVVYDPIHAELFLGVRGHGAWLNGRPIRVSAASRLEQAFLGTGMPHMVRRFAGSVARSLARFAAASLGVRDRGAGALDLCYVACGRLDGYWEIDQSPWDLAAGALMVEEAGGRMSDFRGGPFDIFGGQNVASNGRIHRAMLAVLGRPGGYPRRYRPPQARRRGVRP